MDKKYIAYAPYKVTVPGVGLITPDGVEVTKEQAEILKQTQIIKILEKKNGK